jgi:hypothetical protein
LQPKKCWLVCQLYTLRGNEAVNFKGVHRNFLKFDFETAVGEKGRTFDLTFEGVPNSKSQIVRTGWPRPILGEKYRISRARSKPGKWVLYGRILHSYPYLGVVFWPITVPLLSNLNERDMYVLGRSVATSSAPIFLVLTLLEKFVILATLRALFCTRSSGPPQQLGHTCFLFGKLLSRNRLSQKFRLDPSSLNCEESRSLTAVVTFTNCQLCYFAVGENSFPNYLICQVKNRK